MEQRNKVACNTHPYLYLSLTANDVIYGFSAAKSMHTLGRRLSGCSRLFEMEK
jgi:hypothetical protein